MTWFAEGAGNVLLALLAGAGGSTLLELFWRPRRDRKRAAALLAAEVAMNTELLLLQAHARVHDPYSIPGDFRMSTRAWDTAAGIVSELPVALLRRLVLLYGQYEALNRHVSSFGSVLRDYQNATAGSSAYRDSETMVLRIVDVFNTGLDATLKRGQELLPELAELAAIKETPAEKANIPNYQQVAAQHMLARQQHLEALRAQSSRDKGGR